MTGFEKLENSLIDVIKEEQAKLGFKEEKIHLYYPLSSLNHFFSARDSADEMAARLSHMPEPLVQKLGQVTVDEMERYCQEGHFAAGSMLPKVQAAMAFARKNPRGKAIITSLTRGLDALEGKCGTTVIGGI